MPNSKHSTRRSPRWKRLLLMLSIVTSWACLSITGLGCKSSGPNVTPLPPVVVVVDNLEQFWLRSGDRVMVYREGALYLDTVLVESKTWLLIGNEALLRRWGITRDDVE